MTARSKPPKRRVLSTALAAWTIAPFLAWYFPPPLASGRVANAALIGAVCALALYCGATRSARLPFLRPGRVPWSRVVPAGLALSVHGVAEEVIIRGFALHQLQPFVGAPAAWGLTTLVFAAIHYPLQGKTGLLVHCVTGATFGLLFCLTGGIVAPAVAHFVYNALVVIERTRVPQRSPAGDGSSALLILSGAGKKEENHVRSPH